MPVAPSPSPIPSTTPKRRLRRSCWAATASAKVSARPERISISEAISSPAAASASTSSRLAGGVDVLEAVLELERLPG